MRKVRCAIYTRKSSEEGLEQDFNSLDAQREACAAYILSQASEGWSQLPAVYDDGGISGGTLERPALQRLTRPLVAHVVGQQARDLGRDEAAQPVVEVRAAERERGDTRALDGPVEQHGVLEPAAESFASADIRCRSNDDAGA